MIRRMTMLRIAFSMPVASMQIVQDRVCRKYVMMTVTNATRSKKLQFIQWVKAVRRIAAENRLQVLPERLLDERI
jgi:hypothetical protein